MKRKNFGIEKIKDEESDYYADEDLFNISSWGADLSFRELITRYDEDELQKPEMQRKYVWDKSEASRFIDSLLLGLPVPSIFLAKTEDEKMLIVDGYQRLMTVRDYVHGIFSQDKRIFRLSRSNKINPKWQGKAFAELEEHEQRKIKNTTIHCIIFIQEEPIQNSTSLYQIFERINTSGRTLLPQEIRNCVYQGPFNDLLIELNNYKVWRNLFGNFETDPRMRDMEYILRFFALNKSEIDVLDKDKISLKKHLNLYMGKFKNADHEDLKFHQAKFLNTMEKIYETWGSSAFHNISQKNPDTLVHKFNPTIFDSIAVATDIAVNSYHIKEVNADENLRRKLLMDYEYKISISKETMKVRNIKTRIAKALHYLFGISYE